MKLTFSSSTMRKILNFSLVAVMLSINFSTQGTTNVYAATCFPLTVINNPTGTTGGTVTATPASDPACPAGQFTAGTVVQLTAAPNAGYVFGRWGLALSGSTNPQTITVNSDKRVNAFFDTTSPLANDTFSGAVDIGITIPQVITVDSTRTIDTVVDTDTNGTNYVSDGPAVPTLCDGRQLRKGTKSVWFKYTANVTRQVYFDTLQSTNPPDFDTYIAVWTGTNVNNLTLVACDDDTDFFYLSQALVPVTAGTTYYIEVAQYNGYLPNGNRETATGAGTLKLNVSLITQTDVTIGPPPVKGSYQIPKKVTQLISYPGFNGGPVFVDNTGDQALVSSLRLLYKNSQGKFTYSELMGVPTSQLGTDYWLPYYKNNTTDTDSQIRFTNTNPSETTTVSIYLGNNPNPVYTKSLAGNSADRINLPNTAAGGGPVRIVSSNSNAKILAGMRVIYGGGISFDELMAYPTAQLSTEYWFPFYNHNNVNLDTEMRVANTSSTTAATVEIYIGGVLKDSTTIQPLSAYVKSFPGFNGGPVRVVSTNSINLVASLRLLYKNANMKFTFSELMGVPTAQLSNDYWLPYYKNNTTDTDTQIRFTNTSSTESTTVTIYMGGNQTPIYTKVLAPSSADRKNFDNLTGGPIRIFGDNPNAKILAGMRVIYGGNMSFDELMAYPTAFLSAEYWFPFYNHNNVNLDTEIRTGLP
jgi:hypothetical protein